jgi:hypothetical protein
MKNMTASSKESGRNLRKDKVKTYKKTGGWGQDELVLYEKRI